MKISMWVAEHGQISAATLAAMLVTVVMPAVAAAGGVSLRSANHLPAPAPALAPSPMPSSGPSAPAPPGIRPGVIVRVTASKQQLLKDFKMKVLVPAPAAPGPAPGPAASSPAAAPQASDLAIRYVPLMDTMLGHDYVVRELRFGGVGLPAPDGTQGGTWYFPYPSIKLWKDTKDAKAPPVARLAYKAFGGVQITDPTKRDIVPPGRDDAPWDYKVSFDLVRPVAPHMQEHVDFEKSALRLPPWMKVRQVMSVECLEKIHKDPTHLCPPEDYRNYSAVAPAPTTQAPISPKEAEALRKKINHLEATIHSLTSPRTQDSEVKHPGMRTLDRSLNDAVAGAENVEQDPSTKGKRLGSKMKVKHLRDSESTLPEAQGHAERPCPT